MRNLILSLCFLSGLAVNAQEDFYYEIFSRANDAYTQGQYEEALLLYDSIENASYQSAMLYFNMGNSYFKRQEIPSSILYYERAAKLSPADQDIKHNLEMARRLTVDKIEPLPEFFLKSFFKNIASAYNLSTWAFVSILWMIMAVMAFLLFKLVDSRTTKKAAIAGMLVSLVFFGISFASGFIYKSAFEDVKSAVVFNEVSTVRSEPQQTGTSLFVIHEGLKVEILEENNNWSRIKLPDGNLGWIENTDYVII